MIDWNKHLLFAVVVAGIGSSWQPGYSTGVLNEPADAIKDWLRETDCVVKGKDCAGSMDHSRTLLIWTWIVSIYTLGGLTGSLFIKVIASKLGRKVGLLANNTLVLIAVIFMCSSRVLDSWALFLVGRFVIGVNSGINAGIAPMYLTEISPTSLRGSIGTVYQLGITFSILMSQVFGLSSVVGTKQDWPWLLAITLIPAILQVILFSFCPESPKHLLLDKGDELAARKSLIWLRRTENVGHEMQQMMVEQEIMKQNPPATLKKIFTKKAYQMPTIIAIVMMLAQQLTGIGAVTFFSSDIFKTANLSLSASQNATLLMRITYLGMTFASLAMIEKYGRKTLMMAGLVGMVASTALLFISLATVDLASPMAYVVILSVVTFVLAFATGPGSIPWFFVTELFTQNARPVATTVANAVNWAANFIVGFSFPLIEEQIGEIVFLFFIVIQIGILLFVWKYVPETKGKTVEEITAEYRNGT